MSQRATSGWKSLERWSSTLFLIAGTMFILSAVITLIDIAVGAEQFRLQWGQVTVGAGWMAGLVGLLGLYPSLAITDRRLVRIGALLTAIGLIGYVIMTVGILAIIAGVPEADLTPLEPVFLPLMLLGSVLTFPLFGVAILRSDVYPRTVGFLLLAQTIVFVINALTPTPATFVFFVVIGLVLINTGVGYLLRTDSIATERVRSQTDTSV